MGTKRLIEIWWDMVLNTHLDSNGNAVTKDEWPFIYYKEKPLVNLHLISPTADNPLNPYTELSNGLTFTASIDNDYDHNTDLMCKTTGSGINQAGDWDGGTADYTQGQLSIRLNANNSFYQSKISTNQEKRNTYFELLGYDGTAEITVVIQMPFRTFNIIDDDGATPEEVVEALYIEEYEQGGAKCLRFKNSDGITLETMCPVGEC